MLDVVPEHLSVLGAKPIGKVFKNVRFLDRQVLRPYSSVNCWEGNIGMMRRNPVIQGHEVKRVEKGLTQLWIVRNKKTDTRHFCRVAPTEPSVPVHPLCSRGKKPQCLKKYEILGPLFSFEVSVHHIDHAEDFCQRCKAEFRLLHGLDIVGPFSTYCGTELYPGQPTDQRFILFGSINREKADRAPAP